MKVTPTNRFICWILICAFTLMQVSPAWANAAANWWDKPTNDFHNWLFNQMFGDPVDTKSGNNYFSEKDIAFNAPGVPIVFGRKYNSNETYDSPFGKGWSHSMDWRLHQAREIITKIVPPVSNQNFRVNLWEGTQLLCDGQVYTNSVLQTNTLTIVPKFRYGTPAGEQIGAYVEQPGNNYLVDLNQPDVYGTMDGPNPVPVIGLEDMNSNSLPMDGVVYTTNQWMEVYMGDGSSSRFWDTNTNGIYLAANDNGSITSTNNLWVLRLPGGEERIFNTEGRMIRHQDGWGRGIEFSYNAAGELATAEHDNGLMLQFSYTDGHITGLSAGTGASLSYSYTASGLLDTVTQQYSSKQRIRHFEYTDGVMTKRINPEGHEYNYGYETDASGKLTPKSNSGSVQPGGYFSQSLIYNSDTLTDAISYTRGLEQWNRFAFSSKNGRLTEHFGPGTNTVDAETRGIRYAYNTANDGIENTLFDNQTGQYLSTFTDYDNRHNPTSTAVAYATTNRTPVSSMAWNLTVMLPSSVMNAEGEKTAMTYTNGSLAKLRAYYTASNSYDTAYSYNGNGLLSAITNANNHVTQYTYDSRGYPETVIPAAGPRSKTAYNAYGHLQTSEILPEGATNGTGRVTQYNVNPLGWLESVVYADGLGVSNQYNKLGDLTNTVDRAGRVTELTYTPESCLASRTQYLQQNGSNIPVRLAYDYDQQFNTLRITEPRGRYVESYNLDIQDRITTVTNIEGQPMAFDYSVGSMVTNLTRFDGSKIATTYDTAGRQSVVTYRNAGNQQLSAVNYAYYADSQLKTITDGTTTISNAYDRLNRLTGTVATIGNQQSAIANAYDPVGNLTNSIVGLGGSRSVATAYQYDHAERLTSIQSRPSTLDLQTFDYAYSPQNGRVASVTNTQSGIVTAYAYDLMDRATNISYRTSTGTLIRSLDYQYDALGMITNKVISGGTAASQSASYKYDTINRLVSESTLSGSADREISYSYDLAGNRTQTVDATPSSRSTNSYTLGTGDRLASVSGASISAAFGYDLAGNTTNITTGTNALSLAWNEKYQLTSVKGRDGSPQPSVSYTYDVLGRRVSRTVAGGGDPGSTNTEFYVYNGNQVATDLDAHGNLLRSYTWGPGSDNLLAITLYGSDESDPITCYALKDHQNSIIALADASGNIVESYSYDAYGRTTIFDSNGAEIANHKSAIGNRYLWQGREYDSSTGLYYFRARWYSPETGRWLSKDPIGISGGWNLYVFCGNNPVNFVDPYGFSNIPAITGFGGSVNNDTEDTVYYLHDGQYFPLERGESSSLWHDADGYWVNGEFHPLNGGDTDNASFPIDPAWDGKGIPGSPNSRGAPNQNNPTFVGPPDPRIPGNPGYTKPSAGKK
jgi:RHS repeat-associated protein